MSSPPILSAELLSVGSELTVGETRDTNAGDLARDLTGMGIAVRRIQALPDDLDAVLDAFRSAAARSDLVVSTGGLGPTPDDLTREAIAAAVNERPVVDAELEQWLRGLWLRRHLPFPEMNLKQAWLIPSASALPNPNGTAPGWWVDRPDGGLIVALPGPPREMRPMWNDAVRPRLAARRGGTETASRTFRLAGIGESQVAQLLGDELLRRGDPIVATYARADAVDVRISARGTRPGGPTAAERVSEAAAAILALVGEHVWAEGETTWSAAIGQALGPGGRLAVVEVGTGGALATLLGDVEWLTFAESLGPSTATAAGHRTAAGLEQLTRRGRELGGAMHAIGLRIRERGSDTAASIIVVGPTGVHRERRVVFLGGPTGRTRAALAAADILLRCIRSRSV